MERKQIYRLLLWISRVLPDAMYLRIVYYKNLRKRLDLKHPKSFNEKLQWLKLWNRNPVHTTLVDKCKVRQYIADVIGSQYLIPLLGVWNNAKEIDFDALPNRFVLKCNHDSKSVILCKDKSKLDVKKTIKFLNRQRRINGYWYGREWPYKQVKPCVIAELYLEDQPNTSMIDYKVLCFHGKANLIQVHNNRDTQHYTQDFYDVAWNHLDIQQRIPKSTRAIKQPSCFHEMIALSEVLAKDLIHVRVDWYVIQQQLYFGELTLFDGSGFVAFDRDCDDMLLGDWIRLPI